MPNRIPLSRPMLTGREVAYMAEATQGQIGGVGGPFTQRCELLLKERFALGHAILTHSGTGALEMAALLAELGPGDEVLLPSYTFSSTANALVLRGARPVFVDIREDTQNIDESLLPAAITKRTKAILVVHYAGIACAMERIIGLSRKHGLLMIEDAAQAVDAYAPNHQACGSLGDLAVYSFHESKNVVSGEGGALCINRPDLLDRAEILRDKGTNYKQFFDGRVDKYTWVDVGSSFAPSELTAAFLWAQLEALSAITEKRRDRFAHYMRALAPLQERGHARLPVVPPGCVENGHIFYLVLPKREQRNALIAHLSALGIGATFHFVPLHSSPMGQRFGYKQGDLPKTERTGDGLVRLPLYPDLTKKEQDEIIASVMDFFA